MTEPWYLEDSEVTKQLPLGIVFKRRNEPESSYIIENCPEIEENRPSKFLELSEKRNVSVKDTIEITKKVGKNVPNDMIKNAKGLLVREDSHPDFGAYAIYRLLAK